MTSDAVPRCNAVLHGHALAVAQKLAIPSSTVRSWIRRGTVEVATLDEHDAELAALELKVSRLERRVACLLALVRPLVVLVRVMGIRLDGVRACASRAARPRSASSTPSSAPRRCSVVLPRASLA